MQINIQQQVILSNSSLVEKVQQTLQDKPAIYHALSSEELQKKEAKKQRQVPDSKKSDEVMIKDKESGNGQEKKDTGKRKDGGHSQLAEEDDHLINIIV